MSLKLRTGFPWLRQDERKNWTLVRFAVNRQFEAVRKKGLHHQAHLIFRGAGARACLHVKSLIVGPFRQLGLQGLCFSRRKLIRESYISGDGKITRGKKAAVGRIAFAKAQGEVRRGAVRRLAGFILPDRSDIECLPAASGFFPVRCRRLRRDSSRDHGRDYDGD